MSSLSEGSRQRTLGPEPHQAWTFHSMQSRVRRCMLVESAHLGLRGLGLSFCVESSGLGLGIIDPGLLPTAKISTLHL